MHKHLNKNKKEVHDVKTMLLFLFL